MTIVGQATVVVRALADSFRQDVRRELNQVEKDADASGSRSGASFAARMGDKLKALDDRVIFSRLEDGATRSGDASGGNFIGRFAEAAKRLDERVIFSRLEGGGADAGNTSGASFINRFAEAAKRLDDRVIFSRLEDGASRSGDTGGAGFIGRFAEAAKRLDDRLIFSRLDSGAADSGDSSGRSFASRFDSGVTRLGDGVSAIFTRLRRDAETAGAGTGDGFFRNLLNQARGGSQDFENLVDAAGNDVARNFSAIKIDLPDFGGGLATKILALVPLVGILGGALAALVGGFIALAAAAAFASGALAAITTGVAALGLGLVTGFLAFSGISKAVQALGANQAASGKSAVAAARQHASAARAIEAAQQRVVSANRQLKDAEVALQDARNAASRDAKLDARNISDAEYSVAQAQQSSRQAQLELTQAREDARHTLAELQLSLRGAVIGEEEASLRLTEARKNYQDVLNNPNSNADQREQARLDLENAELNLDQAKQRRQDVTKQTQEANKAGVEGSPQVVKAKDNIDQANHRLALAERALADARQKATDDAIRDARAIAKAQQGVVDAHKAVADALKGVAQAQQDAAAGADGLSASANKLKSAMAGLSPQAQQFARYLFSLKPVLADLKNAAGQELFGPLTLAIKDLVSNFLPTLRHALVVTGGGLGNFFTKFVKAFTGFDFKVNFTAIADGLAAIDPTSQTSAFGTFGNILGNVFRGFTGLANAALPVFLRFLHFIDRITGAFAHKFEGQVNIVQMTSLIGRMGDEAAKIGHIFGATFGIIKNVFKAALPSGQALNDSILGNLKSFQKFTASPAGQAKLRKFFEEVIPVVKSVAHFIGALAKQFLLLGDDAGGKKAGGGGIVKVFDNITKHLPDLRKGIETFTNKVAPQLIQVIIDIVEAFKTIVDSKGFSFLVSAIGGIIDGISGISKVVNSLPFAPFLKDAGTVTGIILAATAGVIAFVAALGKIAKITGLKAIFQSLKVGFSPAGTDRANAAKGTGAFIQGLRGNTVLPKGNIIKDRKGKPILDSAGNLQGKSPIQNRLGRALRPGDDSEPETPTRRPQPRGPDGRFIRAVPSQPRQSLFTRARNAVSSRRGSNSSDAGFLDLSGFSGKLHDKVDTASAREVASGASRPRIAGKKVASHVKKGVGGVAGAAAIDVGIAAATGNLASLEEVPNILIESAKTTIQTAITDKLLEKVTDGFKHSKEKVEEEAGKLGDKAGDKLTSTLGKKLGKVGDLIKGRLGNVGKDAGFLNLGAGAGKEAGEAEKLAGKGGGVLSKFGGVAGKLGGVAKNVGGAIKGIGASIFTALGPVGLIIIGVVALIAGLIILYKHSKTFRDIVDAIGRALKKAGEFIIKIAVEAFKFLVKHIKYALLAFGPLGIMVFAIIEAFKHWDQIKKIVGAVIGAVVKFFSDLPGEIWGFLQDIGRRFLDFAVLANNYLEQRVLAVVNAVVGFFAAMPGRIFSMVRSFVTTLTNIANTVATYLRDRISGFITSVVTFFINLPGRLLATAANLGAQVGTLAQRVATYFRDRISDFIGNVVTFFVNLPGRLLAQATSLARAAGNLASNIGSGLARGVSSAIDSVIGFFRGIPGRLAGLGSTLINAGRSVGTFLLRGIQTMAGGVFGIVKTPINAVLDGIRGVLRTLGQVNFTIGGGSILGVGVPKVKIGIPDFSGYVPKDLALGATILPRPGGTLVNVGEAGRAESVVDTGLINKRLRDDQDRNNGVIAELRAIRVLLEQQGLIPRIAIEKLEATTAPGENAATAVPRALRELAFQLGG